MSKKLRYALFDLDDTIYPKSCGLMNEIGNRINRYMVERLGVDEGEEVSRKRDAFLRAHGTTLNALRRYYAVDPDEFLDFVHDIPLAEFLSKDPDLDGMLHRLELRKVIFTNADARHARRVLAHTGVLGHFETIIDIHMLDFINKPDRRAYRSALDFISARPEECILLEDSPRNIRPARELGMTTVLVRDGDRVDGGRPDGAYPDGAHYHIRRITEFENLLQSIPD